MYTIKELIKASDKLGANPVLVEAALKETGRTKFELSEAKEIVAAFASREVKN